MLMLAYGGVALLVIILAIDIIHPGFVFGRLLSSAVWFLSSPWCVALLLVVILLIIIVYNKAKK